MFLIFLVKLNLLKKICCIWKVSNKYSWIIILLPKIKFHKLPLCLNIIKMIFHKNTNGNVQISLEEKYNDTIGGAIFI